MITLGYCDGKVILHYPGGPKVTPGPYKRETGVSESERMWQGKKRATSHRTWAAASSWKKQEQGFFSKPSEGTQPQDPF